MPTANDIIQELQWLSDKISTQIRTISVGLLAITWGILIAKPEIPLSVPDNLKKHLLIIGVLALTTLFSDYLQYFFGYLCCNSLRKKAKKEKLEEIKYNYLSLFYLLRSFLFWFKQVVLIVACLWFLVLLIPCCIDAIRYAE